MPFAKLLSPIGRQPARTVSSTDAGSTTASPALQTLHEVVRCPLTAAQVTWNTNTLGDFVVLRSNGLPVYNFCVAIDDALMRISHVIRAEEHLPNTLRQVGTL